MIELQQRFPHLVVPKGDCAIEVDKLMDLGISPISHPVEYLQQQYWKYRIEFVSVSDAEKLSSLQSLLDQAKELDQRTFVYFSQLSLLAFAEDTEYIDLLVNHILKLTSFEANDFMLLIAEELINHLARISAFHFETMSNHPLLEQFFTSLYHYFSLTPIGQLLELFDPSILILLMQLEMRVGLEDLNYTRKFLELIRNQCMQNHEIIPDHFYHPYGKKYSYLWQ